MDDEEILARGGTQDDINQIAHDNGACGAIFGGTCDVCGKTDTSEVVHCVEIQPGMYMVSAELMKELEKQVQKTEWKGSIFGVEIRTSDHLPFVIEKAEEELNARKIVD